MGGDSLDDSARGKGQSRRLERQHQLAGGPLGIFGDGAKKHDLSIREVMNVIMEALQASYPGLSFRHRLGISKREINDKLASIDPNLGQVLFIQKAGIKPDGGIIEVQGKSGNYRVVLVSESKHQGNDVEKIRAGVKQGKNKDKDLMAAGNAIERVHKNIQELRNYLLDEVHFPYVVFLQGSNFATETFFVYSPDGRRVKISHDAGNLNRIDRVTAGSYGMEINRNYCRNVFVDLDDHMQMLQAASL
ncbi:MAG: restriction endonuclease, partial [Gammaproteobacteria bacterium]|nr:restriction endonuclease [Gammaproteobacteria bacterium]